MYSILLANLDRNFRMSGDIRKKNVQTRPVPGLDKYDGTDALLTEALTLEAKTALIEGVDKINGSASDGLYQRASQSHLVHIPWRQRRRLPVGARSRFP